MLWLLLLCTTAEQSNSFQQIACSDRKSLVCLLKGRAFCMMISISAKLFTTDTTILQMSGTRVVKAAAMVSSIRHELAR